LGAPRTAIGAEVLGEVLVLGALGAVLGVLVAEGGVRILTTLVPADVVAAGYYVPGFSPWVFAMAGLALLGGMLVAGGVPAWRASRLDPADPLKDNAGTTTGRSRNEFRILVISELAIVMVLLMLTSLLALSTRNLANYAYGYDAKSLLNIYVSSNAGSRDTLARDTLASVAEALQVRMVQTVRDVPGVVAVTSLGYAQTEGGAVLSDERPNIPSLTVHYHIAAGPGFFATTGIPLLTGRDLSEGDALGNGAAVLSRTAARRLFPHGGAVGHMIKLGRPHSTQPWVRVVGVAADVSMGATDSYDAEENPLIFVTVPHQAGLTSMVARISPHARATLPIAIQRALAEVLPASAVFSVLSVTYAQAQEVRANRVMEQLLSMLSLAALILGVTGLFSVLSYSVGQRMREFAVRQALGATPRNIARVVLTGAFEMVLGGTAIGALLSFWASAGISWRLFGVKNTDPVSLVVSEATLIAVALVAALVPALRAMRSDPVEILRSS
ncbi:MAG: FtsX-like permease family protein, partial [Gemmatimonadaceae bacterium]